MRKMNVSMGSLFAAAAAMGSLIVGSAVLAQSTTPNPGATQVTCSESVSTAVPGQQITFSASGGDGVNYTWSSPGLNITNPNGQQFLVSFNAAGNYAVSVTSGGTSATCTVAVTGGSTVTVPPVTSTPGLPNTGEPFGE